MGRKTGPRDELRSLLGVWTWNVKTGIVIACRDVCEYVDIPEESGIHGVSTERFISAIHPEDRGELERRVDEVLGGADVLVAEYRVTSAQHGTVRVRTSGHCFRDRAGNPSHVSGYLTLIEPTVPEVEDEQRVLTTVVDHLMEARDASLDLPRPTLTKLITAVILEASFQLANSLRRN